MKWSRVAVIGIPLLIALVLIYFFRGIVSYILMAWVISMLGDPLMDFMLERLNFKRWKMGPAFAAILVLVFFLLILATIFSIFVPLVVEQARNFGSVDYQAVGQSLSDPLNQLNDWLYSYGIIDEIKSPTEQMQDMANKWIKPTLVGDFFGALIGVAGNVLITLFSVLFISFFFLKERNLFGNFLKAIVPNDQEEKTTTAIQDISHLLTRYFGGIVIQITVITVYITVLISLLGLENAILIGFFAAIINVIPYVGPILGATFALMVTISSNLDLDFYTQMIPILGQVVLVFASMQLIDNFLLQPFIFSNSVKAHPLEIFIVILIGAQLGGILGMILAIPSYTVLRVIARVFLSEFKVVQKITQGMK